MPGMYDQMQGNSPWPTPQAGLEFLLSMIEPPPVGGAFNQGQFDPSMAMNSAMNMGGQVVGMAGFPGKKQLGGLAGRLAGGGDDLARATGGFADNASGTIRGDIPPPRADPGNLGVMDDMAPLGGGAPPGEVPNQAWNDLWYYQNPSTMPEPPAPTPAMNIMASSADPEMLIRQAALDYIAKGASPTEAIQAATLQFSDLLVP